MNRSKIRQPLYKEGYHDGYSDGVLSFTNRDELTHPLRISVPGGGRYFCEKCGKFTVRINRRDRYCRGCGRFIDWENIRQDWK